MVCPKGEPPVEEVKQDKGGKSEEKKAPAAWIVKHHVCNGDSKMPKAASRDITGEHSGCTSQIAAAAEKEVIKDAIENSVVQLQELEEHLQHEHSICDLKSALENKEREKRDCFQRLEDLLLASSGSTIAMQPLEKGMQCLEAKNVRLPATVVQQNSRTETLLQGSPLEQAASQDRVEEIRAHDHEAERKLLLSRMGDLKQELESEKYTLRESIVLKEK
ncbi:uncharacterized protein LOC115598410 [Calypte anna]|uniref:uncharacterized protein LOC115598410 n=1 Tax=Calypte anna TaxID=9244 RepID=UPI0011C35CDA|nr:uncharacterized protein LOC115598410 [Calypte anna]